jgi:hypothetical protein
MEFIDCDVSQFSTARPSLTHNQPNPHHLRVRKTWDEYCHRIQRFNASDPTNQPKSALSAKVHTTGSMPDVKALTATEEPLEAMMRRIISEHNKYPETTRPQPSQPSKYIRTIPQAERDAYNKGRQDARMERPPYQDRHNAHVTIQSRDQSRYNKPPQVSAPTQRQVQGQGRLQTQTRNQTGNTLNYGAPQNPRQRAQERRAFSAEEHRDEDEEEFPYDSRDQHAFSASRIDNEDHEEEDREEDREEERERPPLTSMPSSPSPSSVSGWRMRSKSEAWEEPTPPHTSPHKPG